MQMFPLVCILFIFTLFGKICSTIQFAEQNWFHNFFSKGIVFPGCLLSGITILHQVFTILAEDNVKIEDTTKPLMP